MGTERISIVFECNVSYEDAETRATLWIVQGRYDSGAPELPDDPRAKRLIGPVDFTLCVELEKSLTELFMWLGFEVESHTVADD